MWAIAWFKLNYASMPSTKMLIILVNVTDIIREDTFIIIEIQLLENSLLQKFKRTHEAKDLPQ